VGKDTSVFTDINKGYETALHYPTIDRFTIKLLWWQLGIFILFAFFVSVIRLADFLPSPFSWRVIPLNESLIAIGIGLVITLLPVLLKKSIANRYIYRLLVTFCLTFYSYLFVFITGGAIEAHFHFFIVIGYIATYADWRLGWFAFVLVVIHHTFLDFFAPEWVFFYGHNLLSPIAHSIPVIAASYLTGVLAETHREALISQKKLEKRRDAFISMASHELKTPVTSIKLFAQALERQFRGAGDTKNARIFAKMNYQLDRLTKLIADLLDTSRSTTGKLELRKEPFRFDLFMKETVGALNITNSHKIILQGHVRRIVYADKDRIQQVITNLITNAIKYSPKSDEVIVLSSVRNSTVVVGVRDFGIGIAAEHQQKIFERFYRIDDKDKQYPGLGVGLYIASEIIYRHHGKIWVESTDGKGSTFFFTVPIKSSR
jgi:signal transduction histidine kinase